MAYTPPVFNAVDFDDAGAAYTPPLFGAVAFGEGSTHDTTGALVGAGAVVVGAALHASGHATSGALSGSGSTLAGAAARIRAHAVTGALSGAGSTLAGVAARAHLHTSTGALAGPGAAIVGAAASSQAHAVSGVVAGAGAAIVGSATRARAHTASGTVAGSGAAIAGAAVHSGPHATSGIVAGQGAAISGVAAHLKTHATSGTLAGQAAILFGAASSPARELAPFVFVPRRYGLVLYELLPLRTSGALGNFAAEFVLAHRYGDLTSGRFKLERLDDKTFFAADHPMTIAEVFVDNQKTTGWEQRTQTGSGHTWTVVALSAPAPDGAQLSATGTGKRNPRTGALIENPADIAEDVMRIAGRDDVWWDQLRAEAGAAGLRLAGSIDEALSIREWLDRILKSAAAIWAPGMARLYPVSTITGYVAAPDWRKFSNVVVSATLDNTADVLRLYYDPDKAAGKSQHYIEFTANPTRYDRLPTDRTFDWLRTPQNAESVGKRFLPWLAGERYDVAFDCSDDSIRPGQWVRLVGHPQWPFDGPDPTLMVLSATVKQGSRTISCTGQALVSAPVAVVTAHSVALPTTRDAGVEVGVRDGVATLVVKDKEDRPVLGARVNVDGGAAKTTDANGVVRFPATPGPHRVAIQAPGKRAQIMTMTF